MAKVAIEIDVEQIIRKMNEQARRKLIDKLLEEDFDIAVKKLRQNVKKNKITQKEIRRICEEVRQELYEKRCR